MSRNLVVGRNALLRRTSLVGLFKPPEQWVAPSRELVLQPNAAGARPNKIARLFALRHFVLDAANAETDHREK
jgi:hypothetical protein